MEILKTVTDQAANSNTAWPKSAIFANIGPAAEAVSKIYGTEGLEFLRCQTELYPHQITQQNIELHLPALQDVEVLFSTWGMFSLSPLHLDQLPHLRAVFYAAGSVKHFAEPLLERGIVVSSAWAANAIPVAEFTLAQILLANKGYFRNVREFGELPDYGVFRGRGNYSATVAVLGVGQIGRKLIELLRPFSLNLVVFDPFLSHKAAEVLGVEKVETLEEAFARGDVVTNHLADVLATKGMLGGTHFALLPPNATFINTGRGATVRHEELLQIWRNRPDLTALLDVTEPEPLPLDHQLRSLPNVVISGHIAGSIGDEVERMGDLAITEFARWRRGEPLRYSITAQMLETMA